MIGIIEAKRYNFVQIVRARMRLNLFLLLSYFFLDDRPGFVGTAFLILGRDGKFLSPVLCNFKSGERFPVQLSYGLWSFFSCLSLVFLLHF